MTPTTRSTPTLRIRRSDERGLQDLGWSTNWMTFSFADYYDPDWMRFGPLRVLIESHIEPHSGFSKHPHRDAEIVSYVTSGALRHRDSFGHESTLTAGDMQVISAGSRGMTHSEENPHDESEQHYQIWFIPDRPDTEFDYYELGYVPEKRQGRFRLYVSPDGREESMPVNTDAYIYAGIFAPGDTVAHALQEGRGAWVQVVRGEVQVDSTSLQRGDGAGITGTEQVDLSFRAQSEVLLIDVRMDAPRLWE